MSIRRLSPLAVLSLPLVAATGSTFRNAYSDDKIAFNPKEFRSFPVIESTSISPNTKRIILQLPSKDHVMGMSVSSCVSIKGPPKDGKDVIRPYTPTSLDHQKGIAEFVIKSYPDGVVAKYLCELKVGDTVEVKGPFPKLKYSPNMKKSIGMVAGGTGITPMLQVIQEVLRNAEDKTELHLIFANNGEEDILLKDLLDSLVVKHKNFKVTYVLSKAPANWAGATGFVTKDLLKAKLPAPGPDSMVLVCGPPPMMNAISGNKAPDYTQGVLSGALKDLGYVEEQVFKF